MHVSYTYRGWPTVPCPCHRPLLCSLQHLLPSLQHLLRHLSPTPPLLPHRRGKPRDFRRVIGPPPEPLKPKLLKKELAERRTPSPLSRTTSSRATGRMAEGLEVVAAAAAVRSACSRSPMERATLPLSKMLDLAYLEVVGATSCAAQLLEEDGVEAVCMARFWTVLSPAYRWA